MMDFGWEESSRYNSRKQNSQSTLFPTIHPTSYEPLQRETRFPRASKVNFTQFVDHGSSLEFPATPQKLQKRPLDLQLPADEFIDHIEKLSRNGNGWNSVESAEDLKLSLSIGGGNIFSNKSFSLNHHNVIDLEEGEMRNFLSKKTCSSSHYVIDLELPEPVDRITRFAKSGPSLNSDFLEICPKVKQQGFSVIEPFLPTSVKKISSLDMAESNSFHENSECCQEQPSFHDGIRDYCDRSSKMGLFDLNKALLDDSSCCSDDHSCGGLDGTNGSMEDRTCPLAFRKKETSGMFKQDKTVNLALLDLNKNNMDEDMWALNSEDNSVVTLASPNSGNTLISCHQNFISDNEYIENELSNGKDKSSEANFSVQEVAELLIHISSVCVQRSKENQKSEKVQYSLDSFELNTLNLTESYLDDDSVSSKPLEMKDNITHAKAVGVKLRRGRRMKDFQKEILPSLASLSRHEILEDINIMEGALRSREYRKNRGRMVSCGDDSSAPLRCRRARANNGRRRYYLSK